MNRRKTNLAAAALAACSMLTPLAACSSSDTKSTTTKVTPAVSGASNNAKSGASSAGANTSKDGDKTSDNSSSSATTKASKDGKKGKSNLDSAPAPGKSNNERDELGQFKKEHFSPGVKDAKGQAEAYVKMLPFSKQGLLTQMESPYGNKIPKADAEKAVNSLTGVDWKANAAKQANNYTKYFKDLTCSKAESLLKAAKFTDDEAKYGASKIQCKN